MYKGEKRSSNILITISDDDFDKLKQIQIDYQLKSIEEVLMILVNTNTIISLSERSNEYATKVNSVFRFSETHTRNNN
jgi:hypothetical protein